MTSNFTPTIDRIADFAPKLVQLTRDVLYDDVWAREELSPRDRSLVTLTVLTALGRTDQMPAHLRRGLANGLTQTEIVEMITHVAFYSGWPTAITAAALAHDVLGEATSTTTPPHTP